MPAHDHQLSSFTVVAPTSTVEDNTIARFPVAESFLAEFDEHIAGTTSAWTGRRFDALADLVSAGRFAEPRSS